MAIKELTLITKHLFICNGGTCKSKGAEECTALIRNEIKEAGLDAEIHTTKTLCNGRCKDGPIIISMPDGIWFKQVFPCDAPAFSRIYIIKNEMPEKHLLYEYGSDIIYSAEICTKPETGCIK